MNLPDHELYDVIVVGGGPVGLSAAYQCAVKEKKRVLVIDQYEFGNAYGSSPGFGRQFRICYSELYLCKLAIESSRLWDELMRELNDSSLLKRTGCLWFGDASVESSEGNIDKAVENLKVLGVEYTLLEGKEEIQQDERFSFVSKAVNDVQKAKALYLDNGGTINVPALVDSLVKALKCSEKADLVDNTRVRCIDYSLQNEVRVLTDQLPWYFRAKKVIMTPGTYANHVLSTLTPAFTKRISLTIYLWSSTYFAEKMPPRDLPPRSESSAWPVWYFFGQPKGSENNVHDSNIYYGFPSEEKRQNYARVAAAFTSSESFDFHLYPPAAGERPLDLDALKFTSAFVEKSMPSLSPTLIDAERSTCVAGFAESTDEKDDGAGFVLDFVPGAVINNRIVPVHWWMGYEVCSRYWKDIGRPGD